MTETLIIFSRYPEAGKTKTRMIPALGAVGAAELQKQLTEHTLRTAKAFQLRRAINIQVHFTEGNLELMTEWLGDNIEYIPQVVGDLGMKMHSAFANTFHTASNKTVTIGIDCPDIDQSILETAFNSLEQHDLVIGSATDGGYYLIGLKRSIPQLFEYIDWGTDQVLEQTKIVIDRLNLNTKYLTPLSDVDRPEDLVIWEKHASEHSSATQIVSEIDDDRK